MDKKDAKPKKEEKKEKKPKPKAKPLIILDHEALGAMGNFFLKFFSVGGLLLLIVFLVILKFLEAVNAIDIKIPFL